MHNQVDGMDTLTLGDERCAESRLVFLTQIYCGQGLQGLQYECPCYMYGIGFV